MSHPYTPIMGAVSRCARCTPTDATAVRPIELSAVKNNDETADLVLNVVDEFQARITMIKSAAE